ncbi:hypothetical protein B0H19DRAFT_1196950 [Mycena capillaripes]|nr:hypothetical protein B0H19DRAFT_1196950 [Mycena capillaripes]
MSASYRKVRTVCMELYTPPSHFSKEATQAKLVSFVEAFLTVPIIQKNVLKAEIIFQNGLLDEAMGALGFPKAPHSIWIRSETETDDKYEEILRDPEIARLMEEEEELQYSTSASVFFVDVLTKLEVLTTKSCTHVMIAMKSPAHLSPDNFQKKVEALVDRFLALPIAQQKLLKFSMYVPNQNMATHLRALGLRAPEPVIMVMVDTETEEAFIETATDSAVKTIVADAIRDLGMDAHSLIFSADVVSKVKKS